MTTAPRDTGPDVSVRKGRRLTRDSWALLIGLGTLTSAAWLYLFVAVQPMVMGSSVGSMDSTQSMVQPQVWSLATFGLMLVMWAVMMVAMMVPTAVPMTLVYAAIARKAAREQRSIAPPMAVIAGYIVVWFAFSVAATAAQYGLNQLSLLSSAMVLASPLPTASAAAGSSWRCCSSVA